jgi:flagellar motility protein MotE (MotC chaperone)
MNRIIQSPLTVIVLSGVMFFLTMFAVLSSTHWGPVAAAKSEAQSADDDPSWKFRNPELDQWVAGLKEERDALAVREQELKDWETRLKVESQEIAGITQAVSKAQAEYDRRVILFQNQEKDNIKKQVKVVSGMSPDGAATMLAEMSDGEVIKLLFAMKNDVSSAILDAISKSGPFQAKRAALLAQRLKDVLPTNATNTTANVSP